MPMVTPDVESDFLAKLAALLPGDIVATGDPDIVNAIAGPLRPTNRRGEHEVFVQVFGGLREVHNDGVLRMLGVQVTVRSAENDYLGGEQLARRIHDALELLGAWVGESGTRYYETQSQIAFPNYIGPEEYDQEVFAEPFEVSFEALVVPSSP